MIANVKEFNLESIDDGIHYSFSVITEDGIRYTHPRCIFTKDLSKCYKISDSLVRDNCEIETNQWLVLDMPKTWRANANTQSLIINSGNKS